MSDDNENKNEHGSTEHVSFEVHTKEVQARQNAVERAQRFEGEIAEMKKKLTAFDGVDVEGLKADSVALRDIKRENAAGNKEQVNELIDAEVSKFKTEAATTITGLQDELKGARSKNRELEVVDRAMSKIAGKFNEDMHSFIKNKISESVDVDDNGQFIIKDKEGRQRNTADYKPLSLEDFASELSSAYPSAARPEQATGGKQAGQKFSSNGTQNGISLERYQAMNTHERRQLDPKTRSALRKQNLSSMPAGQFLKERMGK